MPRALNQGNIRALEYQAYNHPHRLTMKDYNGWRPVHEAVYRGDLELVQFLMARGASVHDRVEKGDEKGPDCIGLARQSPAVTEDSPLMQYLLSLAEGAEL